MEGQETSQEVFSLKTDILTDFQESINSVTRFVGTLDEVNTRISTIHSNILNFKGRLHEKIEKNITAQSFQVNADVIITKVQGRLNEYIKKMDVNLVTRGGDPFIQLDAANKIQVDPLKVTVRKDLLKGFDRQIKDLIKAKLEAVELVDTDTERYMKKINQISLKDVEKANEMLKNAPVPKIPIPSALLKLARTKLKDSLLLSLDQEQPFQFIGDKGKSKSLSAAKVPIVLPEKQLHHVVSTVMDKVFNQLDDFIDLKALPKIDLELPDISKVVDYLKAEFAALNESFSKIDTSKLAQLKLVKEEMEKFFGSINKVSEEIMQAINAANLSSAQEAMALIINSTSEIGVVLVNKALEVIKVFAEQIQKHPVSTVDSALMEQEINVFMQTVDNFVNGRLIALTKKVESGLKKFNVNLVGWDKLKNTLGNVVIDDKVVERIASHVKREINKAIRNVPISINATVISTRIEENLSNILNKKFKEVTNAIEDATKSYVEKARLNIGSISKEFRISPDDSAILELKGLFSLIRETMENTLLGFVQVYTTGIVGGVGDEVDFVSDSIMSFMAKKKEMDTVLINYVNNNILELIESIEGCIGQVNQGLGKYENDVDKVLMPIIKYNIEYVIKSLKEMIEDKVIGMICDYTDSIDKYVGVERGNLKSREDVAGQVGDIKNLIGSDIENSVTSMFMLIKEKVAVFIKSHMDEIVTNIDFHTLEREAKEGSVGTGFSENEIAKINKLLNNVVAEQLTKLSQQVEVAVKSNSNKGIPLNKQNIKKFTVDLISLVGRLFDSIVLPEGTVVKIPEKYTKVASTKIKTWFEDSIVNVSMPSSPDVNIKLGKNFITGVISKVTSQLDSFIGAFGIQGDAVISTDDLHRSVRKKLADIQGIGVTEWRKAHPTLEGTEGIKGVMQASVNAVVDEFNKTIVRNISLIIDSYKGQMSRLDLDVNTVGIDSLVEGLELIRNVLVEKIHQVYDNLVNTQVTGIQRWTPSTDGLPSVPPVVTVQPAQPTVSAPPPPSLGGGGMSFDVSPTNWPWTTGMGDAFSPSITMEEFEKLPLNLRNAHVKIESLKARFSKASEGIRTSLEAELYNYLDSVNQAYQQYGVPLKEAAARGESLNVAMAQSYTEKLLEAKARLDLTVANTRRSVHFDEYGQKVVSFEEDALLKGEKVQQKYSTKLSVDDFQGLLGILDQYEAKVNTLASTPVGNDQAVDILKEKFRELKVELDRVAVSYERLSQVNKFNLELRGLISGADKLVEDYRYRMPVNEFDHLLKWHSSFVGKVNPMVGGSVEDVPLNKYVSDIRELKAELVDANNYYKSMFKGVSFTEQQARLRELVEALKQLNAETQYLAEDKFTALLGKIDTTNDVIQLKQLETQFKDMSVTYKELEKKAIKMKGLGVFLGQSDSLKSGHLTREGVEGVLKQTKSLKQYDINVNQVNERSDSWRATLVGLDGEVLKFTGTVDRATGAVYRHIDAISKVARASADYSFGKAHGLIGMGNYMPLGGAGGRSIGVAPGGDTRTFMGSVINTVRYILSGWLLLTPVMALKRSLDDFKQFELDMVEARMNLWAKDVADVQGEKSMRNVVALRLSRLAERDEEFRVRYDGAEHDAIVKEETERVINLIGRGADKMIQNIAYTYGSNITDVALGYQIATRRIADPYEAMAMTREVAKVATFSEASNIEALAKGFEAVLSQWGLSGYGLEKVANMMIMASKTSQASVDDLIQTQQRSGALFRQATPNASLEDSLATSVALSSIFVQAMAQTGNIGGTFFRNILQRPYQPSTAAALGRIAQNPVLESRGINVDPYTKIDGQLVPRNFVDVLGSVMDAFDLEKDQVRLGKMSRYEITKNIAMRWFQGPLEAVYAFVDDLGKSFEEVRESLKRLDKIKGVDVDEETYADMKGAEILTKYIERIRDASPEDVSKLMAMKLDTLAFQEKRTKIAWDSFSVNLFNEFKGNFSRFVTSLNIFIRALDRHSYTAAELVKALTRVGVGLAANYVINKSDLPIVSRKWWSGRTWYGSSVVPSVDENRAMLNEEGRVIALQKMNIERKIDEYSKKSPDVLRRRSEAELKLQEAKSRLSLDEDQLISLQKTGAGATDIASAKRSIKHGKSRVKKYEGYIDSIDSKFGDELGRLKQEMAGVEAHATHFNDRVRLMNTSIQELGLDTSKFKHQLSEVNMGFRNGTVDVTLYEKELLKLRKAVGISDQELAKIDGEIMKLTADFNKGGMSIEKYTAKLAKLQRARQTAEAGVVGGGITAQGIHADQTGFNLMNMVAKGSMLYGGMQIFSRRGVAQRFRDMIATRSPSALLGGNFVRDELGNLVKDSTGQYIRAITPKDLAHVAPGGGIAGGIGIEPKRSWLSKFARGSVGKIGGKLLKAGIYTAGIPLVINTLAGLGDYFAGTPADHMNVTAQSLDDISKNYANLSNFSNYNPAKYLKVLWDLPELVSDGIVNLLTGTRASFKDHIGALKQAFSGGIKGENLREKLKKDYDVDNKKAESQRKLQEENIAIQLATEKAQAQAADDYWKNIKNIKWENIYTEQQWDQTMEMPNKVLTAAMTMGQGKFDISKSRASIKGFEEDSIEVRKLMEEFLEKQIEILDVNIKAIDERIAEMRAAGVTEDDPAMLKAQSEWATKQAQIIGAQAELIKSQREGPTKEAGTELERNRRLIKAEATSEISTLMVQGAKEDSLAVRTANINMYRKLNESINQMIAAIQAQMASPEITPGSSEYKRLFVEMKELQAEQLDNLVKIREQVAKTPGTFNLPSGIEPMTYWEAMTRNNTHRSVTVRSGNTIINVTIDNMTGSMEDTERLVSAVGGAVRRNQAVLSRELVQQVNVGMGHNYNPVGAY